MKDELSHSENYLIDMTDNIIGNIIKLIIKFIKLIIK